MPKKRKVPPDYEDSITAFERALREALESATRDPAENEKTEKEEKKK